MWGEGNKQDYLQLGRSNVRIPIRTRKNPPKVTRALVRTTQQVDVLPGQGINLPVRHRPLQPREDGYLFTAYPIADLAINRFGSCVNAVMNGAAEPIPFSNFGDATIRIPANTIVGIFEAADPLPEVVHSYLNMADIFEGLPPIATEDISDSPVPMGAPFLVHPPEEDPVDDLLSTANISDVWGDDVREKGHEILREFKALFRNELGRFNDGINMPIVFKADADLSDLRQAAFNLSKRERDDMDTILDPMKKEGTLQPVPLGEPPPIATPAFVVYRNEKPRVVLDMRRFNTKLQLNAYPLPRQETILGALGGSEVFSSLDLTKGFFQQPIAPEDRWKMTLTTAHRGLEQLTVATMGLATSPAFFQARMEKLFGNYLWRFVLVYIDDIIIYSRTVEEHFEHLRTILRLLENSGVTLSLTKCFFLQPSIKALGRHVSRLGIATLEDKVEAIRALEFPKNLRGVEHVIGLFGYYRQYIPYFADIIAPLQELKKIGFKDAPRKGKKRERFAESVTIGTGDKSRNRMSDDLLTRCRTAFVELQDKLCTAPVLAFPDFDRNFILYVDGSKERGFGVALHQEDKDGNEKPILYLSKELSAAEKHYWPTELETAALVWALQKLPQYLDGAKFTVVTDHLAIRDSFRNGEPLNKRGPRLTSWRLFLAKYMPYMSIVHRSGKTHLNADALSRLKTVPVNMIQIQQWFTDDSAFLIHDDVCNLPDLEFEEPRERQSVRTTLDGDICLVSEEIYTMATETSPAQFKSVLLHIDSTFGQTVAIALPNDKSFRRLYKKMVQRFEASPEDARITTFENFRYDSESGLIYFRDTDVKERLCIPDSLIQEVFKMAHDNRAHIGTQRTYDWLKECIFIRRLWRRTRKYVSGCPVCKLAKPDYSQASGLLMPIPPPESQMVIYCVDFVTALPLSTHNHNAFMSITDQLSKWICVVKGRDDWSAEEWADAYYSQVYEHIGLPEVMISDRDSKFTGHFWQQLCSRTKVRLSLTTACHPQADGQSEVTNKTLIHTLRCAIAGLFDQSGWEDLLPYVIQILNESPNASTGFSPYHLRFGRLPRTNQVFAPPEKVISPMPLTKDGAKEFITRHEALLAEATDAIKLAQARMKIYYDEGRKNFSWQVGDMVYLKLAKGTNDGYKLLQNQTKLSFIKLGPYPITEVVNPLAFRVGLPQWLSIHPVISVDHLELDRPDEFGRPQPNPGPIIDDNGVEKYIVEEILSKEMRKKKGASRREAWYLVRHLGYDDAEWIEGRILREDIPNEVRKFERQLQGEGQKERGK